MAEMYDFPDLESLMESAKWAKASALAVAVYERTTGPFHFSHSGTPTPEEEIVLKLMSDLEMLMESGSGELIKALDKLVEEGTD